MKPCSCSYKSPCWEHSLGMPTWHPFGEFPCQCSDLAWYEERWIDTKTKQVSTWMPTWCDMRSDEWAPSCQGRTYILFGYGYMHDMDEVEKYDKWPQEPQEVEKVQYKPWEVSASWQIWLRLHEKTQEAYDASGPGRTRSVGRDTPPWSVSGVGIVVLDGQVIVHW